MGWNQITIDRGKIAEGVSKILEGLGEKKTNPDKVAEFLSTYFLKQKTPKEILSSKHIADHHEMIIVKDIPFYSFCEHHMLPFFGTCNFAYVPENNQIVGLSTITELIETLSKKLQLQETLTTEIAETFMEEVQPKGLGLIMKARHLCMEMRGIQKPATKIITSAVRGLVKEDPKTREEFLKLTSE